MVQEKSNLDVEWRQFLDAISYHNLDADEQVELLCLTPEYHESSRSFHYSRLEDACHKARDLGPDCNIFFLAVKRSATTFSDDESTQILAYWAVRDKRPDDIFSTQRITITCLQQVSWHSDLELLAWRHYPDGQATREAGWFYYRSRRHQRRRTRKQAASQRMLGDLP